MSLPIGPLPGLVAFLLLPVARFPQITPPSVVVSATFPGADAATIEQSIAAPIETQVNGVPHMIYMDSKSASDGSYTLTVTFEVGADQDIAAVDVQNQVAIAQRGYSELSKDAVDAQRRIVDAFERAQASGVAAVQVDGLFVDYPIYRLARRRLAGYESGLESGA